MAKLNSFSCSRIFFYYYQVKNSSAALYFCENCDIFLMFLWWTESSKEQCLFETEIIYNIINVLTATFDLQGPGNFLSFS